MLKYWHGYLIEKNLKSWRNWKMKKIEIKIIKKSKNKKIENLKKFDVWFQSFWSKIRDDGWLYNFNGKVFDQKILMKDDCDFFLYFMLKYWYGCTTYPWSIIFF